MKLLVKTRGQYSLMDPYEGQDIRMDGYTVVRITPFIEQQRAFQIETVAELPDSATDAEWLEYVAASGGNLDLAKASYLASFETAPAEPAEEKPKRAYNKRKDA